MVQFLCYLYFCFTKILIFHLLQVNLAYQCYKTQKLQLPWSAAAENGGKILTYTVWWREVTSNGGVGNWFTQNTSSDGLTYTLTGLKVGTIYDFGITAWNKYGESALDETHNLKQIKMLPSMYIGLAYVRYIRCA